MSEWVIKFNGLSRTADIEVHVFHRIHVIITYDLEMIIFPLIDIMEMIIFPLIDKKTYMLQLT